jgi:tRNA threonylcarbamoyladenosine biosynthesis protein TsaB
VSISQNGIGIGLLQNEAQNEHASFLQKAVKKLMLQLQLQFKDIDAVAVVNGPGSYTGLRVGLSSAKGICFAAQKPLITLGSLPLMAKAVADSLEREKKTIPLLCPMIDARRLEVFTAVYNASLEEIFPANAKILTYDSFVDILLQEKMLFFGNGSDKFRALTNHPNSMFTGITGIYEAICCMGNTSFNKGEFANLAYVEPMYLKEFYNGK